MSWLIRAQIPDLPPEISEGADLLRDEKLWRRSVSTPGELVRHDTEGWTGKVIELRGSPTGDGRVLVEHEFEGRPAQRWYDPLYLSPMLTFHSAQRFDGSSSWGHTYRQNNPDASFEMNVYQSPDFPHVFLGGEDEFAEAEAKAGQPMCEIVDCRDLPEVKSWDYGFYSTVKVEFDKRVQHLVNLIQTSDCPIYVHCALGANRSVSVLASAISILTNRSIDDILSEMKSSRSIIGPDDPYLMMAVEGSPSATPEFKEQTFTELNRDEPLMASTWLKKIANDLRPPYAGSMWSCPECSAYNYSMETLPQCPGCNRDTTGLRSYLCPDCKTQISTGKKGDCDKCGFDWVPRLITLEEPISSLGGVMKNSHMSQLAYDVGAKTINDVIRVDYETIKSNLFEWKQRERSGFGSHRWEGMEEEEIARIQHTQVMGDLHNLIFAIFNYTEYPYVQLPPEYVAWATYLNDSFKKDSQVLEHKDNQAREIDEYENKQRREGEAKEQKARMLADVLYRQKDEIWSDMDEKMTPEEALEIARNFINAGPYERGQWRGPIRDIAKKLFSREFPEKQYFMEPEEAHTFIKDTQRKLEQRYANKWELVKDDELLDIISKAVGITNSKNPHDLEWNEEGVHPGYTSTYVLAPAANMRYFGMQELSRRLKEKKDDQAYLRQMYLDIDEDIRPLFFKSKLASRNWLQKNMNWLKKIAESFCPKCNWEMFGEECSNPNCEGASEGGVMEPPQIPQQVPSNVHDPDEPQSLGDKLYEQKGIWLYPFNQVKQDAEQGWYLDWFDEPGSISDLSKVSPNDKIADRSLNLTPYWEVSYVDENSGRIYVNPIEPNPFVSGVGAGGKEIGEHDMSVFSGEYEKERIDGVLKDIGEGRYANPRDVAYILLGTVPTNMGPNGAQGGWYNLMDRHSNRGGKQGLDIEEMMMRDAASLKKLGFAVPQSALDGTLSPDLFSYIIDGGLPTREEEAAQLRLPGEDFQDINAISHFILTHPQPSIKIRNWEAMSKMYYNAVPYNQEPRNPKLAQQIATTMKPVIEQMANMYHQKQDKFGSYDQYEYLKEKAILFAEQQGWMDVVQKFEKSLDPDTRKMVLRTYGEAGMADNIRQLLMEETESRPLQAGLYALSKKGLKSSDIIDADPEKYIKLTSYTTENSVESYYAKELSGTEIWLQDNVENVGRWISMENGTLTTLGNYLKSFRQANNWLQKITRG